MPTRMDLDLRSAAEMSGSQSDQEWEGERGKEKAPPPLSRRRSASWHSRTHPTIKASQPQSESLKVTQRWSKWRRLKNADSQDEVTPGDEIDGAALFRQRRPTQGAEISRARSSSPLRKPGPDASQKQGFDVASQTMHSGRESPAFLERCRKGLKKLMKAQHSSHSFSSDQKKGAPDRMASDVSGSSEELPANAFPFKRFASVLEAIDAGVPENMFERESWLIQLNQLDDLTFDGEDGDGEENN